MKRIISFVTLICILVALSSCSADKQVSSSDTERVNEATEENTVETNVQTESEAESESDEADQTETEDEFVPTVFEPIPPIEAQVPDHLQNIEGLRWHLAPGSIEGEILSDGASITRNDHLEILGYNIAILDDGSYAVYNLDGEMVAWDDENITFGEWHPYFQFSSLDSQYLDPLTNMTVYDSQLGIGGLDMYNKYLLDEDTGVIYEYYVESYKEIGDDISAVVVCGDYDETKNYPKWVQTGKYGIASEGKLVIPCEYDNGTAFDEFGIAALEKKGKWAYFDREGNQLTDFIYEETGRNYGFYFALDVAEADLPCPGASSYGYIAVCRDGKYGYIDLEGNIVIDCIFDDARGVCDGKAWVKTAEGWGVIELEDYVPLYDEEAAKELLTSCYELYFGCEIQGAEPCYDYSEYYGTKAYFFNIVTQNANGDKFEYLCAVTHEGVVWVI